MDAKARKILLLTNEFRPFGGGIATYCHGLCEGLHRTGQRIFVIASRKGRGTAEFDKAQPFPIYRAHEHALSVWRHGGRLRLLRRIVNETRPDWLWASDWRTGFVVAAVAAQYRLPFLVSAYGTELLLAQKRPSRRILARSILRKANTVLSISSYTTSLLTELGVPQTRIKNTWLGTDLASSQITAAERQAVASRHGLAGRKVILTIARLIPRKGQDMVIAALPELLEWVPDAIYLVAGTGSDADRLQQLAASRGLERQVVFSGFVPEAEKAAYYSACDVFALISRRVGEQVEGFGLSLLEAAACSKPVVAGKHGGAPDAVVDGVTGILVDPMQPRQVAGALRKLLTDPDLALEMGRKGRQRVLTKGGWERTAQQVLAIMRSEEL